MSIALVWFRRDLRLADNPALQAAIDAGHDPVPVYVHCPSEAGQWGPGAASRAWLARSLGALDRDLSRRGSGLVVLEGASLATLEGLVEATGAEAVYWNRQYEPWALDRDRTVKQSLRARGLDARSFNSHLLVEPWQVSTQKGEPYRVFTPFWKQASQWAGASTVRDAPRSLPKLPDGIAAPNVGQAAIKALDLEAQPEWDTGFWERFEPGEAGALEMLDAFVEGSASSYLDQRDLPDRAGTSRLSPHLAFGEIAPWRIVERVRGIDTGAGGQRQIEGYVRELGWREFSYHLLFHFPRTPTENLNPRFDGFPWADGRSVRKEVDAWRRGRTGIPIIDAAMRELWHTGWMHNRARMLVASLLTKNLRVHWSVGAQWFWDTLVDADLANNTQGWQWTAGTGADAAPYFRIFNPVTQGGRFDPDGRYVRRWCPELASMPVAALHAPWEHRELLRKHAPEWPAEPIVDLRASREAALEGYQRVRG